MRGKRAPHQPFPRQHANGQSTTALCSSSPGDPPALKRKEPEQWGPRLSTASGDHKARKRTDSPWKASHNTWASFRALQTCGLGGEYPRQSYTFSEALTGLCFGLSERTGHFLSSFMNPEITGFFFILWKYS